MMWAVTDTKAAASYVASDDSDLFAGLAVTKYSRPGIRFPPAPHGGGRQSRYVNRIRRRGLDVVIERTDIIFVCLFT